MQGCNLVLQALCLILTSRSLRSVGASLVRPFGRPHALGNKTRQACPNQPFFILEDVSTEICSSASISHSYRSHNTQIWKPKILNPYLDDRTIGLILVLLAVPRRIGKDAPDSVGQLGYKYVYRESVS